MNAPKWTKEEVENAQNELKQKLKTFTKWADFDSLGPEYIVGLWPFHGGRYVVEHTKYAPPGSSFEDEPPNTCVYGGTIISNNKFEDSFSFAYVGGGELFHSFHVFENSTTKDERDVCGLYCYLRSTTEITTPEPALMRCVILNVFEYEPGEERESQIIQALDVRNKFFEKEAHQVKDREISLFCIET